MVNECFNFINGESVPAKSGARFEKKNPADVSDVLGSFPDSGKDDIDVACNAAAGAFKTSWSMLPAIARGAFIREAADKILSVQETLVGIIARETGKTFSEARGEVVAAAEIGHYLAEECVRMQGNILASERQGRLVEARRVPVGVYGIITAWNSPLAIVARDLFPALACGNTVVLKPSEDAPMTACFIGTLFDETGFPPGVVNIVHGKGATAGEALVENRHVKGIAFTGSTVTGAKISARCGQLLKRCSLEMGGKNVLIVMDDADLHDAAEATVRGAFSMAGQRCAATSRVLVHEAVHDEFMKLLIEHVVSCESPIINDRQFWNIMEIIDLAAEHASVACGGHVLNTGKFSKGYFIESTIFSGVDPRSRLARDEIFGPVLCVFKIESLQDAIDKANDCDYGLTASIYTKSLKNTMDAVNKIQAGVVYVNAPTYGAEPRWPFGGMKCSGNGTRVPSLDFYTDLKTICIDYNSCDAFEEKEVS